LQFFCLTLTGLIVFRITSAEEVMFSSAFFCLLAKTAQQIFTKFGGKAARRYIGYGRKDRISVVMRIALR